MVHIPRKALFPSTSSARAPVCRADPQVQLLLEDPAGIDLVWPQQLGPTLHPLPPGRKYENAVPAMINMMNLLCRLPRKIPFRGGDGCTPGTLRRGACHPPATRPREIDGHLGGDEAPSSLS